MGERRVARLRTGGVAILDILGAKDLFATMGPEQYLESLKSIRSVVEHNRREVDFLFGHLLPGTPHVAFFLDTLLLCVVGDNDDARPDELLNMLSSHIGAAIHAAAMLEKSFTYRGCVAVGDVAVEMPFFAGPAVNEAAQWYEKAEAGMVWFTPSAHRHSLPSRYRLSWNVPLKGGQMYQTQVVNPLTPTWDGPSSIRDAEHLTVKRARAIATRDGILRTFDTSKIDVAIKRANTAALLDHALDVLTADDGAGWHSWLTKR